MNLLTNPRSRHERCSLARCGTAPRLLLTSAYGSRVMARSSADALRRTRMFTSTNHRVITVGKMMVRTLVTVVGSPAAAWIRPARN